MSHKEKKDWTPEPFPKPRTYPKRWDASALTYTNGKPVNQEQEHPQSSPQDDADWKPEKFPKPRTYPKNWSIDD